MYRKIWDKCHASICSINFLSETGTSITKFTGFKVLNYLITDDIVEKLSEPAEVVVRFSQSDGHNEIASKRMTFDEFRSRILKTKNKPGYVILDANIEEFRDVPALSCSKKMNYRIGHPVAILGYQLVQENLSIKSGIISSFINQPEGLNFIQVDCSIKQGNAGSPLIDAETGEVIGVIGYRLTTIARSYQEMMRIIKENLKLLKEAEGKYTFDEIDPVQVLIVNQNQIKYLATEFYKSANMRVGFAVELCNLVDDCLDTEEISSTDMETRSDK